MPRILLLPLDERPCNFLYPALMVEKCTDVQLLLPPKELMGSKKRPAPFLLLAQWLGKNFSCCDYAVISIDMLVYGGIVPSRLHHQTTRECLDRLHLLADLRARYPQVKLFAFSLIMRAPCYNSADEEPDYYAEHGSSLFRVGVLRDKIQRNLATAEEKSELSGLEQSIPRSVLSDFCSRRSTNHAVNLQTIFLAEQGVLDFLTIPLDDCALLGWAAAERQQLAADLDVAGGKREVERQRKENDHRRDADEQAGLDAAHVVQDGLLILGGGVVLNLLALLRKFFRNGNFGGSKAGGVWLFLCLLRALAAEQVGLFVLPGGLALLLRLLAILV